MGSYGDRVDADLVQLARAGDRNAFAVLFHRHAPVVNDLALRTTGSGVAADDVLRATFVTAMRDPDLLLDHPARLALMAEALRRSQAAEPTARLAAGAVPVPPVTDGGERGWLEELAPIVWELSGRLPAETRVATDLSTRHGLDVEATAIAMGRTRDHTVELVRRIRDDVGPTLTAALCVRASSCPTARELASSLRLDEPSRALAEDHIARCEVCGPVAEAVPPALTILAALGTVPLDEGNLDAAWLVLDGAWPDGEVRTGTTWWHRVTVVGGAIVLVAAIPAALIAGPGLFRDDAGDEVAAAVTATPVEREPEAAPTATGTSQWTLPRPPSPDAPVPVDVPEVPTSEPTVAPPPSVAPSPTPSPSATASPSPALPLPTSSPSPGPTTSPSPGGPLPPIGDDDEPDDDGGGVPRGG